jgi:type IV pilus assembly protein PilW
MHTNPPSGSKKWTLHKLNVAGTAGFSLIELMVGIVVALICTLAIMAAFAVFEGQKRTTTNGDDAQQNGSYALYYLERQIRTAGSGIVQGNSWGLWGCPMTAKTAGSVKLAAAPAAPFTTWPATTRAMSVLISAGANDASGHPTSDVIGIVSGSPAARVFKAAVTSTPSATSVVLGNAFGIFSGDYLIGVPTAGTCALVLTNTAPDATGAITFDGNNSAAVGLTGAAYAFDMGPDPIVSLYGVDPTTNSLVTLDLLGRQINGVAATNVPIADGIVIVKALYGVHDATSACQAAGQNANCIDEWVSPAAGTPWAIGTINASVASASTAMNAIKAVRVAVVAQSRIAQRTTDYSTGKITLSLFSDLPALTTVVTTDIRYRYKVYDTTIPIRNGLIQKYF